MCSAKHRDLSAGLSESRPLLMVAHPGHELRVHGWLESARPMVCVLTDGSGRTNRSRLDSTTRVLFGAGCVNGSIYGAMTDQDLYNAVLNFNHEPFLNLVDELAAILISEQIDYVAGDAAEGYNPAHDVCRIVINAAVAMANRSRNEIKNFDFNLVGPPEECPVSLRASAIYMRLDEHALARKLAAAHSYPELQAEVAAAFSGAGSVGLQQHPDLGNRLTSGAITAGTDQFVIECLRPVDGDLISHERANPFYEAYGERQVAAGHYTVVLRYREHMLPLLEAINSHVQTLSRA